MRLLLVTVAAWAVPGTALAAAGTEPSRGAAPPGLVPQLSGASGFPAGYTVEYLLGVALVLAALGALAFAARRMQGHGAFGRGALRVESSLPLGGKDRLLIVQVEGERLLLGVGAGGVRTLSRLGPGEPSAGAEAPAESWLARTLRREAD